MQAVIQNLRNSFPSVKVAILQKLLMHTTGVDDISRLLTQNLSLTQLQTATLHENIQAYCQGKPIEYITGLCNFYGMDFSVNQHTLIPRIETELLVEMAITEIGNNHCKVLDLCTGSGAIAVAVAKHCPNAKVIAVDVSSQALSVCQANIKKFSLQKQIQAFQMNILEQIPQGIFDVILSNPPYIETATIFTLSPTVKNYEPHLALDGGQDGLKFYKTIYEYASSVKNATFILEIGFNQGSEVYEIFKEFSPQIVQDYNQNNRIARFLV